MRFSVFGVIAVLVAIGGVRYHQTNAATLPSIQIAQTAATPTAPPRSETRRGSGFVTQISFSPMEFFRKYLSSVKVNCKQLTSGGIIWEDTSELSGYNLEILSSWHGSTLVGKGLESVRTTDHICHETQPPSGSLSSLKIATASYVSLVKIDDNPPCWYVAPDSNGYVNVRLLSQASAASTSPKPTPTPYTVIERTDESFIIVTNRVCTTGTPSP